MKDRNRRTLRLAAVSLAILSLTAFAAAQEFRKGAPADKISSTVNIDESGRIPYQVSLAATCNELGTVCTAVLPTIPAGHRLVVEHLAGDLITKDSLSDAARVQVLIQNGHEGVAFPTSPFVSGVQLGTFDQPIRFYVDAGQTPVVKVRIGVSQVQLFNPVVIGYELDCSQVSCAPITGAN